ncbi:MAG: hypothetical protein RR561_01835 [Peptostreptococcus sp.]
MVIFVAGMLASCIGMFLLIGSIFIKSLEVKRRTLGVFFVISLAVFFTASIAYTKTLSKEEIRNVEKYNRENIDKENKNSSK